MFSPSLVMVDLFIWLVVVEGLALRERRRRYRLVGKWLAGKMTEEEIKYLKEQRWFKWKPIDTDPPSKKLD